MSFPTTAHPRIPEGAGTFYTITFPSCTPFFTLMHVDGQLDNVNLWQDVPKLIKLIYPVVSMQCQQFAWTSTFRCGNKIPALRSTGRILLHLCTLMVALGVRACSLPSQLMKLNLPHQEVFSGTAQIFTYSFSYKPLTG